MSKTAKAAGDSDASPGGASLRAIPSVETILSNPALEPVVGLAHSAACHFRNRINDGATQIFATDAGDEIPIELPTEATSS